MVHTLTGPSPLCLGLRMDRVVQGVGLDSQTQQLLGVTKAQRCDSPQELRGQPRSPLIPSGCSVSTQRDCHCQNGSRVTRGQCPGWGQVCGIHEPNGTVTPRMAPGCLGDSAQAGTGLWDPWMGS